MCNYKLGSCVSDKSMAANIDYIKSCVSITIHLQEDHKSEIKSCTIDIAQKEVSIRGSCNT